MIGDTSTASFLAVVHKGFPRKHTPGAKDDDGGNDDDPSSFFKLLIA